MHIVSFALTFILEIFFLLYKSRAPRFTVLEQAKDHCKQIIKETKAEIAFIENPNGMYDLVMDEVLEDADADRSNQEQD